MTEFETKFGIKFSDLKSIGVYTLCRNGGDHIYYLNNSEDSEDVKATMESLTFYTRNMLTGIWYLV